MSCDVALSAAILLASFHPGDAQPRPDLQSFVQIAIPPQAANPLAREPLYAEIVARAGGLRARVEAYRGAAVSPAAQPGFDRFKADVASLSALDMQGHVDLAARGTDGDLKCILKGISQDLTKKLAEVEQATTPDGVDSSLKELVYLLRDNIEVITTPPSVQSGSAGL